VTAVIISLSMLIRKLSSSVVAVTILQAWILPA
jgi:hypothetical protein